MILDVVGRNLRQAIRMLLRAPAASAAIVLTLALGIGASSAVFTAMDAVLFRSLPFPDSDRLVSIRQTRERAMVANVAPVRLEEWFERSSSFEAVMGYTTQDSADVSVEPPESIRSAGVSPRMMEVWGVAPILGRAFVAADHAKGASPVAIISEALWERRFGRDPNVIGMIIVAGDQPAEIVGVMPAEFAFPEPNVEVWSAVVYEDFVLSRSNAWYTSFGRLRPGITPEQAQTDLNRVQASLAAEYPETDRGIGAEVLPLKETMVGDTRASLWLMFGAVFLLLVIACTNIAALLLARATDRQADVAMRFALGASGRSIAGQVLTEAALLAVLGAALGFFVAEWSVTVFKLVAPGFPRIDDFALNGRTLVFVSGTIVGVTLLCGTAPAMRSGRPIGTQDGTRGQVSGRDAGQWFFVGVQVALSVALLAGAGLLIRSFLALTDVDLGYNADSVLTFRITGSFAEPVRPPVERILAALEEMPGIEAVATASPVPGVGRDGSGFQFGTLSWESIEGVAAVESPITAENRIVSPSYFETMQIPLLAGARCRFDQTAASQEIVVNEAFVRAYLQDRPPVGTLLRSAGGNSFRIGSVVGDAREFGARRTPVPTVYRCFTVVAFPPLTFLARTSGDSMSIVSAVRQRIAQVEPSRSVYDVRTLDDRIGNEYSADRLRAILIGTFALAALTLVCLGIYGTLSCIVSRRRREVGLRVALGAVHQTIVALFLFRAFKVVGLASLAGLLLSFIVSRGLANQLFGVSFLDPLTLVGVVVLILAVSGVGALMPAISAARVDPMTALREE